MQLTPEELAKRAGALGQQPGVLYGGNNMTPSATPPRPSIMSQVDAPTPKTRIPELDQNPSQQWRSRATAGLNRSAQFDANTAARLAGERAARIEAMNSGGIGALDKTVAAQENPAFRRTPDAPGAPPQQASAPRATGAPAPGARAPSVARSTLGMVGNTARGVAGRVAGLAKAGIAPAAIMATAGDVIGTDGAVAKRDQFMQDVGANDAGVLGTLAADTTRVLGNVGNTITFGLADRVGTGISDMLNGGSFIDGFKNADGETSGPGQLPAQPTAAPVSNPAAAPSGVQPGATNAPRSDVSAPTAPASGGASESDVLGTFNGREITRGESNRLAGQNVVAAPSSNAGGMLGSMPTAPAPADFRGDDRSNRVSTQRGAEKRLEGLYSQYNDLMSRGKRRGAAVVADLIGKELGVVQGLAGTQTQQGQQPQGTSPQDIAEMGRIQALTEGAQMDNRAKALLQQTMMDSLDETKTPEQREAARQRLAAMRGDNAQQRDPKIVNVPGADGISTMPARVNTDGTYTVLQPSAGSAGGAAPAGGTAQNGWPAVVGPDGRRYRQNPQTGELVPQQ